MTLMSMTGFGEGTADDGGLRATATVRGVNNKQLEVRAVLPGFAGALESVVVDLVRARCHRGRVDVKVTVSRRGDGEEAAPPSEELAMLVGALRDLQRDFGLAGDVTVADVLRAGGSQLVWSAREPAADAARGAIVGAVEAALDAFDAFRRREGEGLDTLFRASADELDGLIDAVSASAVGAIEAHRARLSSRVAELLAGRASGADPDRLEQEVVLLAERSDIAEELQRAREHVRALRAAVGGPGPHGKRLDFILQELVRETNTMASKSVSATLTHHVVDAKTTVERLREQAQNLE